MTIIVYRDGVMAADRSATVDGKHLYAACKIYRGKTTMGAMAGSVIDAKLFREWVEHDMEIPYDMDEAENMFGIAFTSEAVYLCDASGFTIVPGDHVYSSGSGSEIALGALDMGATAGKAALVAALRMGCAQYGIDVGSLDNKITTYTDVEG